MTRDRAHALYGFAPQVFGSAIEPLSADVVRFLLRNFHNPTILAASQLARGSEVAERAESVRQLFRDLIDRAFGHSTAERALRRVLEVGYLEPDGGHARAMRRLHLSRTTYFRRLREATDRLTARLQA